MATQFWGSKKVEAEQDLIPDPTWSLIHHYQAIYLSTIIVKAGNKDYALSGTIEQSGEASAKLKTSEIALKRKYAWVYFILFYFIFLNNKSK